tara:strand:+ start:151 stop:264 length:114 start_codon:yes stop_codon:yes gene_type:complete
MLKVSNLAESQAGIGVELIPGLMSEGQFMNLIQKVWL